MEILNQLLESEPYIQYAVRKNILKQKDSETDDLKNKVLSDARIKKYLRDVEDFNGVVVNNHKNPELPIHKLIFLLDIGLGIEVPEIQAAVQQILKNKAEDGMYKCMTNIPKSFGGTGQDILSWCLCDAPLMLYALLKAGATYESQIKKGVEYITGLHRSNGFPCAASMELGKFRGPGRKEDCCPYASLIILKLFALISEYSQSDTARLTVDALLNLWENSMDKHPFMFYMGTDFRKLKAPSIWYDIVSVADCLSQYEIALHDLRFQEMVDIIEGKRTSDYQFIPESVYLKCKEWDFGQKKQPSPWLTYLCLRILERSGRIKF